ncbi:MAG: XrtA/PEP-CTERM system histidine kinase PrsK [Pseudomonadota bacterium]
MLEITFISYGVAALAFGLLTALLLRSWHVKPLGPSLVLATFASTAWSITIAVGTRLEYPPIIAIQLTEIARDVTWIYFLLSLCQLQAGEGGSALIARFSKAVLPGSVIGACAVVYLGLADTELNGLLPSTFDLTVVIWLILSVSVLVLTEQIYRNATYSELWGLKFLCLGMLLIFGYDFLHYASAMLFASLQAELWQARGLVNAIAVPWLAISIARNRSWRLEVYVSRQVVFHSITLLGAGSYLIGMSLAGYALNYFGGEWGSVLQVSFLAAAIALLGSVLFSASLRARLRVYLSKNFFRNRYDYREEWLKFTNGLATIEGDLGLGIIKNLAPIVSSEGGVLYTRTAQGSFSLSSAWRQGGLKEEPSAAEWLALSEWFEKTGWVVDLQQLAKDPSVYSDLPLPDGLAKSPSGWLVVPLLFQATLEGLIILKKTPLRTDLIWEDHDLLKTVGRQAASYLAQARVSNELMETSQFAAFNRLSAYIVHDLKNILAQQSLLLANAKKHRSNPAFIDDMLATVQNSVNRMQRLMEQMRSGERSESVKVVDVYAILERVVAQRSIKSQELELKSSSEAHFAQANPDQLATVISHLVQNAQEAVEESDGKVVIELSNAGIHLLIQISDTGIGMTEEFIQHRLFKPFESTKGLTGMGIGAFEAREYVRQLGGDISVDSVVGCGSVFTITIPAVEMEPGTAERYAVGS